MLEGLATAWGGVSGARLDPAGIMKAMKIEVGYAERKPVWAKNPRHVAGSTEWKIIKSRWIDVNKGYDENLVYRSRMVGN